MASGPTNQGKGEVDVDAVDAVDAVAPDPGAFFSFWRLLFFVFRDCGLAPNLYRFLCICRLLRGFGIR